jgi:hypothetical protein
VGGGRICRLVSDQQTQLLVYSPVPARKISRPRGDGRGFLGTKVSPYFRPSVNCRATASCAQGLRMISGARSRRGPCERISGHRRGGVRRSPKTKESGVFSDLPRTCPRHFLGRSNFAKSLILWVGAPGFGPGTPSPPNLGAIHKIASGSRQGSAKTYS